MVAARVSPEVGGIETHVSEIAPRLADLGFDVTVLATHRGGKQPAGDTLAGVRVRRFAAHPRRRDWYIAPALFAHLVRTRYDLVHIQGANNAIPFLTSFAALLTRTPFVVTFHSGGAVTALRRRIRRLQFRLLGLLVRHAAALIAVSRFEAEVIRDATGLPLESIAVVRNGGLRLDQNPVQTAWPIDTPLDDQDVLVVSVGRLEKYKGHDRAVAAMTEISRRMERARLLILGIGPAEAELRGLISRLGLEKTVSIGYVPPQDRASLVAVLERADLLVLLSDYEAHPVAVMEAIAVGTKTLVTMNSGMTELVAQGWSSGVRPDASPSEIAAAVVASIASGPAPVADNLPTWESCAEQVADICAGVLSRPQRRKTP